jgi:hypothetical protein
MHKLDMKNPTALLSVLAVSFLLFLSAPNVPNWVLQMFVNTYVGVILLIASVLVALYVNPILALAVFLTAGAFFLENRKRILIKIEAPEQLTEPGKQVAAPISALTEGSADVVEGEAHPEHEEPSRESHSFEPDGDSSNEFRPVGESINMKQPLETATPHEVADHYTRSYGLSAQ